MTLYIVSHLSRAFDPTKTPDGPLTSVAGIRDALETEPFVLDNYGSSSSLRSEDTISQRLQLSEFAPNSCRIHAELFRAFLPPFDRDSLADSYGIRRLTRRY